MVRSCKWPILHVASSTILTYDLYEDGHIVRLIVLQEIKILVIPLLNI